MCTCDTPAPFLLGCEAQTHVHLTERDWVAPYWGITPICKARPTGTEVGDSPRKMSIFLSTQTLVELLVDKPLLLHTQSLQKDLSGLGSSEVEENPKHEKDEDTQVETEELRGGRDNTGSRSF